MGMERLCRRLLSYTDFSKTIRKMSTNNDPKIAEKKFEELKPLINEKEKKK